MKEEQKAPAVYFSENILITFFNGNLKKYFLRCYLLKHQNITQRVKTFETKLYLPFLLGPIRTSIFSSNLRILDLNEWKYSPIFI